MLDKEVKDMLPGNIIEENVSLWSSLLIMVLQKDRSVRLCIDFRKLNAHTVKDCSPLLRIDDVLDPLQRATIC